MQKIAKNGPGRWRRLSGRAWTTIVLGVLILVPSMLGFIAKFMEFIHTFRGEADGVFAITPMVNYALASLGFLCMLTWAGMNGMFRDIEGPKDTMLARESALDRDEDSK